MSAAAVEPGFSFSSIFGGGKKKPAASPAKTPKTPKTPKESAVPRPPKKKAAAKAAAAAESLAVAKVIEKPDIHKSSVNTLFNRVGPTTGITRAQRGKLLGPVAEDLAEYQAKFFVDCAREARKTGHTTITLDHIQDAMRRYGVTFVPPPAEPTAEAAAEEEEDTE